MITPFWYVCFMKNSLSVHSLLALFFIGIMAGPRSACTTDNTLTPGTPDTTNGGNNPADTTGSQPLGSQLKITVGSATFTATLFNNATVTAFKARLPMTVSMSELNGNEKLYNFPSSLPTNAANPGTIQTGDLMLYGSNTLVLFYKTFPTSYSYTRLGRISNPSGLAAALGAGSATVTFALE